MKTDMSQPKVAKVSKESKVTKIKTNFFKSSKEKSLKSSSSTKFIDTTRHMNNIPQQMIPFPHPLVSNAPWHSLVPPHATLYPSRIYRKGKWEKEETAFTEALVTAFNDGHLTLPIGTTLRTFLSDKLNW